MSEKARERYMQATLEVEHVKDILQRTIGELREIQAEQHAMLVKMAAQCQICRRLINLICAPASKEIEGPPDDTEKSIEKELSDWH